MEAETEAKWRGLCPQLGTGRETGCESQPRMFPQRIKRCRNPEAEGTPRSGAVEDGVCVRLLGSCCRRSGERFSEDEELARLSAGDAAGRGARKPGSTSNLGRTRPWHPPNKIIFFKVKCGKDTAHDSAVYRPPPAPTRGQVTARSHYLGQLELCSWLGPESNTAWRPEVEPGDPAVLRGLASPRRLTLGRP